MPDTSAAVRRPESLLAAPVLFSFFAIYVIWGSTYLAIRIAVAAIPPLLAAGVRFTAAGVILVIWAKLRGTPNPSAREWRNLSVIGAVMFLASYSALFWAEKSVPSGVASVLVAMIPVWTALLETSILKRRARRGMLAIVILMGLAGVSLLALGEGSRGSVSLLACLAVTGGAFSWSLGTVLSKVITLPKSNSMSSGAQMTTGGLMLLFCSLLAGDWKSAPHFGGAPGLALLYLIVAGSLISFSAYTWLLSRMPATTLSSYAYVNPVIALLIGWWMGGEKIGLHTFVGAILILISVVLIVRTNPVSH